MKKILLFLVAMMLATIARAAVGDVFSYEGLKYRVLSETEHQVEVARVDVASYGEITIPASVTRNGSCYDVTSIGYKAFRDCGGLRSVTIPNSVTSIGESAFSDCIGLTSVTIPGSVTSIGDWAFYYCRRLTSVAIPNSVTRIGKAAFWECDNLLKSAYPSRLSNPFPKGIAIEYPGKDAIIEDGIIYGPGKDVCYFAPLSLEGYYSIPESVTTIGESAFSYCSGLTSVIIPNSVTTIGESAFRSCSGLTSVAIPNSVTTIGENAFRECSNLRKSAYPSGLSNPFSNGFVIEYPGKDAIIEDGIIYGPGKDVCYFAPISLEGDCSIPESVTTIGGSAFSGCRGLTSVTIPNSVTRIGNGAFEDCSGLTSVTVRSAIPPTMNDDAFEGSYATATLSVPDNAVSTYLATNWTLFENLRLSDSDADCGTYETGNLKYRLIQAKAEGEENMAIVITGDYSSLTEVTIPERITVTDNGSNVRYYVDAIGYKAFNGCSSLATVTFNSRNAAKAIGDYAFAGTNISAITIPETVETIGDYAFNGCTSLKGIVIPGSVKTIGDYAFNGCSALTTAELKSGVKTIGQYAFYKTSALKEVTLNEGLESIGAYAFSASRDRNISPLYIPSTLKSVGEDAFYNFNCKYVNISDLASWCNVDFANSNSNPSAHRSGLYLNGEKIENLVIPESVTNIKDYSFCYNRALKSVIFNDELQGIGTSAFYGCSGLTSVTIPGSVTTIGDNAFGSTSVRELTFAYGTESVAFGEDAFPNLIKLFLDRPIECMTFNITNLNSLTIGNSITEVPAGKFKGVSALTQLALGSGLKSIADEAFSGCTSLTEVILPPSVETIGASAFAGNNSLTSIIMGHSVKNIGEKAFDLCPAQTVSITAQTPPNAPDNTFSNYTGSLYVQGQAAAEAYYDADFCWYQFEGHVMIEPTEIRVEGDKNLNGKPGDTFRLSATLYPDNVTLPQIFWRSTNPAIATVDANGLVTLHADMSDVMAMVEGDDDTDARSCKIIAESLYADGPVAEFTINDTESGIEDIIDDSTPSIDFSAPVQVFNLQGVMVSDSADNLAPGIYIIRQGNAVKKVAVK